MQKMLYQTLPTSENVNYEPSILEKKKDMYKNLFISSMITVVVLLITIFGISSSTNPVSVKMNQEKVSELQLLSSTDSLSSTNYKMSESLVASTTKPTVKPSSQPHSNPTITPTMKPVAHPTTTPTSKPAVTPEVITCPDGTLCSSTTICEVIGYDNNNRATKYYGCAIPTSIITDNTINLQRQRSIFNSDAPIVNQRHDATPSIEEKLLMLCPDGHTFCNALETYCSNKEGGNDYQCLKDSPPITMCPDGETRCISPRICTKLDANTLSESNAAYICAPPTPIVGRC